MFRKSLLKTLSSLSPEEKEEVRKALDGNQETEKVDEEKVDETTENVEEKTENENSETTETEEVEEVEQENEKAEVPQEQVEVEETEPNGVRIQDLVTKEELYERLSALEAKFEAVLKENEDLKTEGEAMKEKYENKDFGNLGKKGVDGEKNKYQGFDEYSKQFIK